MKQFHLARVRLFCSLLVTITVFMPVRTHAFSFGTQPYNDVLTAAAAKKPADLSTNEFAAMILAVTWPETTGGTTNTPSPMTLGRADISKKLYSYDQNNSSNPYKRAFWHAGVGAWQLDPSGLGTNLHAEDAINTYSAANHVATYMASRWTTSSGTKAQRRANVWGAWFACSGGACETIFQTIYNSSTDTLTVTKDPSVGRYGGGHGRRAISWGLGQHGVASW